VPDSVAIDHCDLPGHGQTGWFERAGDLRTRSRHVEVRHDRRYRREDKPDGPQRWRLLFRTTEGIDGHKGGGSQLSGDEKLCFHNVRWSPEIGVRALHDRTPRLSKRKTNPQDGQSKPRQGNHPKTTLSPWAQFRTTTYIRASLHRPGHLVVCHRRTPERTIFPPLSALALGDIPLFPSAERGAASCCMRHFAVAATQPGEVLNLLRRYPRALQGLFSLPVLSCLTSGAPLRKRVAYVGDMPAAYRQTSNRSHQCA
jgi:hypothetical protein